MDNDEVEMDPKDVQGQYQALHAEADKLAASVAMNTNETGLFAEAIDRYNRALVLVPNQLDCLVNRARCFMMQGDSVASLEDVNKVLEQSPSFIRAVYQKAETLYSRGDFEDALVLFHRGARARPELVGFEMGIHKCIEAIRSAVVLLDTVKMKAERQAQHAAAAATATGATAASVGTGVVRNDAGRNGGGVTDAKLLSRALRTTPIIDRGAAALQLERNLIQELQDDKLFLLDLLSDARLCRSCDGEIADLINQGLDYIETRVEFWRQGNPNAAPIATVKAAVLGSRLNLAHEELVQLQAKKKLGGVQRPSLKGVVGNLY
ncbi:Tetratricopeptide repeat protein 25 [Physocladia obscura]|uniref:Outer dynein arm-docking complex subunit 4 n=1 Tax=Physocladia obscura TaxID=109957 RepID=A0AAD5T2B6_9FUNG|nr:Tetratricopeptide repeat protein 25 [Physocladia obscura]